MRANLKLPHQERHTGSIEAALDDENDVREFGCLRDPQIFFCQKFKHSDE